jgi:ArsR family transcriptional regulator
MFKPTLETEAHQLHAEICAALADPSRILMLYALASRPRSVSDLCADLQLEQPFVSRHLKVLRERGLVTATRVGPNVLYGVTDDRLIEALDLLRGVLRDSLYRRGELARALSQN